MKYEKSCGAVVFRWEPASQTASAASVQDSETGGWKVLLIRHVKGRHISFPKGHMEAGETESQTAEREVREETGLSVHVDRRYRAENRYNIRQDTQKLVVVFAAVTTQKEVSPQPEEIAECSWFDVAEAEERLTYERDKRILRAAFEHILKTREETDVKKTQTQ